MAKLDLSLTAGELEAFVGAQRTVRVATADPRGRPHVVPLWYVWLEGAMFMNSTLGNLTVRHIEANPRVAALVDDGETYDELRGVLLHGPTTRAVEDPQLPTVAKLWSRKYLGGDPVPFDRWRNRVWLRLDPETITSWDFRKIPEARARAKAAGARSGTPGG
jgi:hypothetical protein